MTLVVDRSGAATGNELAGLAGRFETTAALARSALEYWRHPVRRVLLAVSVDRDAVALRGLAAWYERLCVDVDYAQNAPDEGLDALVTLRSSFDAMVAHDLLVTYWAIRVAEELATCRARCWSDADGSDDAGVALAKLELALLSALERSHN